MLKNFITVFIFIFISLISNPGIAAEIYKSEKEQMENINGCSYNILIYGNIVKGDALKFKNIVEQIKQSNCVVSKVAVSTPGGDVLEAMEIGTIIRKNLISTEAPVYRDYLGGALCSMMCNSFPLAEPCLSKNRAGNKNNNPQICTCDSVCFLIWAAGVIRVGNYLGLHRPYYTEEYFSGLTAPEAKKRYDELSIVVRDYLLTMSIPAHVIDEMFSRSSHNMLYLYILFKDQMEQEAHIKPLVWVPFFEEWIISKCGPRFTDEEYTALYELRKKSDLHLGMTTTEKFAYQALKEKRDKLYECLDRARIQTQLNMKEKK